MKKILVINMLYPNFENPHFGIFIKREVESLADHYSQIIVVPTPWRPSRGIRSLFKTRRQIDPIQKVEVIYKSYFPLPGALFQPIKGLWFFLFTIGLIKKLRKEFDFDMIHAHNVYPEGFCAFLIKKIFKKPLVISSRGNDLHKLPDNILLRPMIKYALNNADGIITVSKSLSQKAIALGADPKKISVMPKGVDTNVFKPSSKTETRKKLNLPVDKTIVLSVGWLIPRKNPFSFIKILKTYTESARKNFLFVWIGEGPLQSEMENEIHKNNLENYVKFVGRKNPDEVATWMNASDIFMLVSFSEGMPNVLYEAMACGTPIIASNVDGAAEILKHMKTGILVPPDDYNQMAIMVRKLAEDHFFRNLIGKKGLNYLLENDLNWENNAIWLKQKYQYIFQTGKKQIFCKGDVLK
jgi:teichuronic acid biosynthesis glycosyltransferase TuaC